MHPTKLTMMPTTTAMTNKIQLQRRLMRSMRARKSNSSGSVSTPMSATAMGRALVLLATSCAAFRSGGSSHHVTIRSTASQTYTSAVGLRYRNGDEDLPVNMQITNAQALEQHMLLSTGVAGQKDPSQTGAAGRNWLLPGRFLSLISPPSTDKDEQQLAMDEYLDYTDRRYSRLRQTSVSHRPKVILDFPLARGLFFSTLALHTPVSDRKTRSDDNGTLKISSHAISRQRPMNLDGTSFDTLSSRTVDSPQRSTLTSFGSLNKIGRATTKVLSSLRILTNFLSLRVLPELLEKSGISVASLAVLLMFRPLLKAVSAQG